MNFDSFDRIQRESTQRQKVRAGRVASTLLLLEMLKEFLNVLSNLPAPGFDLNLLF